jgi:hypothetical protein
MKAGRRGYRRKAGRRLTKGADKRRRGVNEGGVSESRVERITPSFVVVLGAQVVGMICLSRRFVYRDDLVVEMSWLLR